MSSVISVAELVGTRSEVLDDPAARRLLQCAQGALHKWPEGFPGFSAAVRGRDGREVVAGHVRVHASGRVDADLPDGPLARWVVETLRAISVARTPQFFKDGDGRYPITFDPSKHDETTRAVRVHVADGAARVYRIDAKCRIRHQEELEPGRRATVTYAELMRACPGRVLPTRTRRLAWDVKTQTFLERADVEDAHERRDHAWLPACRRMMLARGAAQQELTLELSGHAWL